MSCDKCAAPICAAHNPGTYALELCGTIVPLCDRCFRRVRETLPWAKQRAIAIRRARMHLVTGGLNR